MALSQQSYPADGATSQFNWTKPFLSRTHVKVYVDGVEDMTFTWISNTLIQPTVMPTKGQTVLIDRDTPTDALTDFNDGSTLVEDDLDRTLLQAVYVAEEVKDELINYLRKDAVGVWDAGSARIKNVADGSLASDAVNKAQRDAVQIANGNVPIPRNPLDDGKVLGANGGVFSWTSFLISMISDAQAFMKTFLGSADAAAARSSIGAAAESEVAKLGGATFTGKTDLNGPFLLTGNELTISDGSVTPTSPFHRIDTEADAAADDLHTIVQDNLPFNSLLLLTRAFAGRNPTIKHTPSPGPGQIITADGKDILLDGNDYVMLRRRSSRWEEVFRSVQQYPAGSIVQTQIATRMPGRPTAR